MFTAVIKFTQGLSIGADNAALRTSSNATVTVASVGDHTGVSQWTFTVLDAPIGSAYAPGAVLSSGLSTSTTFTPDVVGSYSIELSLTDGDTTLSVNRVFTYRSSRSWTYPPFRANSANTNYSGNSRGYMEAIDQLLRDVESNALFRDTAYTAASGDVLRWNGSAWAKDSNAFFLDEANGASSGQVLNWNGSAWVPVTPGGGGSGTTQVLIYRPGSTQSGNNYTSWTDLMTAFAATKGLVFICFDSQDAAVQIPAGAYNFQWRAVFVGLPFTDVIVAIDALDGAECQNVIGFQDLQISCQAIAGNYNFTWGASPVMLRLVNTNMAGTGDGVGFGLRFNNSLSVLYLLNGSRLSVDADAPVKVEATKTLTVYVDGSSEIEGDSVKGGGTLVVYALDVTALISNQPNVGTFTDSSFRTRNIPRLPDAKVYYGVAGLQTHDDTAYKTIGVIDIDPSILPPAVGGQITRTLTFRAVVLVEATGSTITVRLKDESGAVITGSTITSTAAAETAPEALSAALTIGASPNVQNARQMYRVEVRRNGGAGTDKVFCYSALMELSYATV